MKIFYYLTSRYDYTFETRRAELPTPSCHSNAMLFQLTSVCYKSYRVILLKAQCVSFRVSVFAPGVLVLLPCDDSPLLCMYVRLSPLYNYISYFLTNLALVCCFVETYEDFTYHLILSQLLNKHQMLRTWLQVYFPFIWFYHALSYQRSPFVINKSMISNVF